jgi:hypothetical protein
MYIWSVAVDPRDAGVIYAGAKPPAMFRTLDRGKRWERLAFPIAGKCLAGPPKVTDIVFDPRDPRTVWMSVEIDGVYCSATATSPGAIVRRWATSRSTRTFMVWR